MEIIVALVIVCFAFLLGAWGVLDWVWLKPKKLEKRLKEQGFKGSPYKPLFGDSKEIERMVHEVQSKQLNFSDDVTPRIIPYVLEAFNKYGKKAYLWFGTKPLVLITEPEHIKEVTMKYIVFLRPVLNPQFKLLHQGVTALEGHQWAKRRKLINPAFRPEKLKFMIPAFYTSVSDILGKWDELVSPKGSCEVDVWPGLGTITSDAISRTAFGSNFEQGRRIFELQGEQFQIVTELRNSVAYIPGSRFMPTRRNRRMKQISKEVNGLIGSIVDSRTSATREKAACDNDLLDILLKESSLSREDVIEECKIFYVVGQETTALLLNWTMVLLSRYQNWQNRAREEIFQVFGTNEPDHDGINRLKIVNMILCEVLRLYPPERTITRVTAEETKLGNHTLPAGVLVGIPTHILHTDSEIWGDDAKQFNPERFSEGVANATKGKLVYFPFGWGPRICLGQNFALLEAKMAMALILQRFSFQLSPSYTHAPSPVLEPVHGTHLILNKLL